MFVQSIIHRALWYAPLKFSGILSSTCCLEGQLQYFPVENAWILSMFMQGYCEKQFCPKKFIFYIMFKAFSFLCFYDLILLCVWVYFLSALICECWFIDLVFIWHTVTANKFWKIENLIQLKFDTVLIVFFLYALVFRFICRTWFTFSRSVKIKVKTFDRKGWKETGNLEKYHTR